MRFCHIFYRASNEWSHVEPRRHDGEAAAETPACEVEQIGNQSLHTLGTLCDTCRGLDGSRIEFVAAFPHCICAKQDCVQRVTEVMTQHGDEHVSDAVPLDSVMVDGFSNGPVHCFVHDRERLHFGT